MSSQSSQNIEDNSYFMANLSREVLDKVGDEKYIKLRDQDEFCDYMNKCLDDIRVNSTEMNKCANEIYNCINRNVRTTDEIYKWLVRSNATYHIIANNIKHVPPNAPRNTT